MKMIVKNYFNLILFKSIFLANYSWHPYFEPDANRLFLQPSFPREPKIFDRKSAYKKYENFFITCKSLLNQLPEVARNLDSLLVR